MIFSQASSRRRPEVSYDQKRSISHRKEDSTSHKNEINITKFDDGEGSLKVGEGHDAISEDNQNYYSSGTPVVKEFDETEETKATSKFAQKLVDNCFSFQCHL